MTNFPFSDSGFSAAFDAIQEHMDRVLRGAGAPAALRATPQAHFPPVNVGVSADSIEVVAFVPGVEPYESVIEVDFYPKGDEARMVVTIHPHTDPNWTKMAVQGFASQQIMVRDGGFKVRTDLLADKVGRSDDWLVATNFTTSVPSAINPLSLLPVKIPLKIFADVGTYSDAWKPGSGLDRFIFDAGLRLSIAKVVHFYMPLVYSGIFRDYIQSTIPKKGRIWKTVSFAIDISNLSLRKVNRNLNF